VSCEGVGPWRSLVGEGECPEVGGENASIREKIHVLPLPGAIPRQFPPSSGDSSVPWGLQVPRGGAEPPLTDDITQLTFASPSPGCRNQKGP